MLQPRFQLQVVTIVYIIMKHLVVLSAAYHTSTVEFYLYCTEYSIIYACRHECIL